MIGRRLKELRLDKGISLSELSRRSGVSKSYISNIERGVQKNPSLIVLRKLSKTLDVTIEQLVAWKFASKDEKSS
ncbi:helix-turn-helix domain-containing protein [Thalassobacillus hwangdonensis]|uniref:Helix-turn-helix domain-containing protein n=1 Tax=Thalassobacillus hwangdonensis TaxID=546108 RepID=A0ABW3L510_9BACI